MPSPTYYFPTAVGTKWVYEERVDGERVGEYEEVVTRVERVGTDVVVSVGRVEDGGAVTPVAHVVVGDRRLSLLPGDGAGRAVSIVVDRAPELGGPPDPLARLDRLEKEAAEAAERARSDRDRRDRLSEIDRLRGDPLGAVRAGRAERVVVPAGEFTAVPVTATPQSDPMDLVIRYAVRAWYAPDVGLVRRTAGPGEVVLKSFTPGRS